jgi:hypothetical protein
VDHGLSLEIDMPSKAYQEWRTIRREQLDKIEHAHGAVGLTGRGRWYGTQQVNQAYVILLASHFQGFCRDLYDESAEFLVGLVNPGYLQPIIKEALNRKLQLAQGNAQPGSIGDDFGRLVNQFWGRVKPYDPQSQHRFPEKLDELNKWRNAIAHQDFSRFGGPAKLRLAQVRQWRGTCNRLARIFDTVMHDHSQSLSGTSPW